MKMKSLKAQFIGAIAMVLVAAIAMGSSTYAWFAMNSQVDAKGMKVKAVAEDGIVISHVGTYAWGANADANYTSVAGLKPTSTNNTTNWYHASSDDPNDAKREQDSVKYTPLTITLSDTTNGEGVGYVDDGSAGYNAATDSAYYLLSKFKIKSSGDTMSSTKLYINNVSVDAKLNGAVHALQALDVSLRVAIVVTDNSGDSATSQTYIYAPVDSVTTGTGESAVTITPSFSYVVAGDAANKSVKTYNPTKASSDLAGAETYSAGKNLETAITTISNNDDKAVGVAIYVYFEGEDANCKSINISNIPVNDLDVTVKFGTSAIA